MPSVSNEDYDDDTVAALPLKAEIAGVCRDGFGRLREGVPTGQVEMRPGVAIEERLLA